MAQQHHHDQRHLQQRVLALLALLALLVVPLASAFLGPSTIPPRSSARAALAGACGCGCGCDVMVGRGVV
jgi:hypothetical protein